MYNDNELGKKIDFIIKNIMIDKEYFDENNIKKIKWEDDRTDEEKFLLELEEAYNRGRQYTKKK